MNVYDNEEYWCGDIGYRAPGYTDFTVNTIKEVCILCLKPVSVLDIGCAYGFTVGRLRQLGIDAWGIDVSKLAISRAELQYQQYLVLGDVCKMPFGNNSFDLAFSSGMLEHVPKGDLNRAISEMQRVCRMGLIGVACSDDITSTTGSDDTHEVMLTQKEWQEGFNKDFRVISDSTNSWRQVATLFVHRVMYRGNNG